MVILLQAMHFKHQDAAQLLRLLQVIFILVLLQVLVRFIDHPIPEQVELLREELFIQLLLLLHFLLSMAQLAFHHLT